MTIMIVSIEMTMLYLLEDRNCSFDLQCSISQVPELLKPSTDKISPSPLIFVIIKLQPPMLIADSSALIVCVIFP